MKQIVEEIQAPIITESEYNINESLAVGGCNNATIQVTLFIMLYMYILITLENVNEVSFLNPGKSTCLFFYRHIN